jgi:hypothetical protein
LQVFQCGHCHVIIRHQRIIDELINQALPARSEYLRGLLLVILKLEDSEQEYDFLVGGGQLVGLDETGDPILV